ncbi:MAG TPA: PAS domain-containing protein [Verrucomicrobiae bacterium]|jgi:PAS domain S-box-containing protein|nr:PAS domain-containing protein [Verrucomicrobiae bacterium]
MSIPPQKGSAEACASEQSFRQLAEAIGAVFRITDADEGQIVYVSPGYEEIWGRSCDILYQSSRAWFDAIHAEDRDRMLEVALSIKKHCGYDEEYRILRPDGSMRWVRDRGFPVRNEKGEVYRIAAIAEDITEHRLLEKEVIEINDRERSRLGQDLHDGICQQLVSIAFATDLLRRDLIAKSPGEAVRAAKITALLDSAITQARNLSNALCPVNLAGDGLAIALRGLASNVSHGSGVVCGADCSEAVFIHEYAVATHLYRIAQEAVQNAIKHANPSQILIRLSQEGDNIHLSVTDNGLGSDEDEARNFGIGLSIIKFRTTMAGGRLQVHRNATGGTLISCSFQQKRTSEAMQETDFQLLGSKV